MSNPFKVGDRVRRTAEDSPGGTSLKGQEHVIKTVTESITSFDKEKFGPQKLTFGDQTCGSSAYYSKNYELVSPAVKTDEELAAEYRAARKVMTESGKVLRERGYSIRRDGTLLLPSSLNEVITIKKTVTTTKEI